MNKFQQLRTTMKGTAGETIASGIIAGAGWTVYGCTQDKAHPIDFLCHKPGKGLIGIDVKCYPRRWCCEDTGLDRADYEKYTDFEQEHGIAVHLVWVDEFEQACYGAPLAHLARQAEIGENKVYFPLSAMRLHRHLFDGELARLRSISRVDLGKYAGTEHFFTWGRVQALSKR